MAEHIKQHKEDGLGDSGGRASYDQYHLRWIARWTRANNNPVPQSHHVSYASNEEDQAEEKRYLQVRSLESRKVEVLKLDMNEKSTHEYKNVSRADLSKSGRPIEVHKSAELTGAEMGRSKLMNNLMVQENVKLHDAAVALTDACLLHEMPDSSVNLEHCEQSRFLTFKNISMCQRMTKCLTGFLNQDMQHYISDKCSSGCAGSSSYPTIRHYENWRPYMRSSILINEEEKRCSISSQLHGKKENQISVSSSRLFLSWEESLNFRRFSDLGHVYELFRKMSDSSIFYDEMKMHNNSSSMENTRAGAQNFSNASQSFFMTNKMCMDSSCVELSTGKKLRDSTKAKGLALYEMVTLPTRSEGEKSEDAQCSLREDLLPKSCSRNIDISQMQISQEGWSSNGRQEDPWCSTNQLASTSQVEQAIRRDAETDEKLDKTALELQEQACSRWLKRLSQKSMDYPSIGSKKSKTGDGPSSGKECCLSTKQLNYTTSGYLKGKQVLHENMKSTRNTRYSSGVAMETLSSWIQRWCSNSSQTTQAQVRLAGPVFCNTTNYCDNAEDKQLPSVAAMALMGRVMKQFHSCVFHRRGSSVIWNIEDL
ncbi:hypothetical protein Cni_G19738 [Canna indica]|uniref:Uncharacterized protein n=1 Tax=Canna indica TaxID=4628 RepID=A0AAQ3KL43_9LILI|nr:hypothetical protein Cni_G19738 [Canna indica]